MADITIESRIAEVTVYTDRARVTRRGSIKLQAGEQRVTVESLPATLQDDTVRAGGRGAGVRILGVEVVRQFVTEAPEANVAELQKQLEALQDQDTVLADADAAISAQLEFLKSLRESTATTLPRGISLGRSKLEDVQSLVDYLGKEWAAALARRREIGIQRRELARQIGALQGRMAPNYDRMERRQINVFVEAAAAVDAEIEVTYGVTGASWQPLYDVRLVESKVSLGYLANVTQQTGEDWPAVQLSLSTARPAVSTTIPELDPWYLDVHRPRPPLPPMARMAAPAPAQYPGEAAGGGAADAYVAQTMMAPEPPPMMKVAQATVESTGASVTFKVGRPVDIPSDGSPHKTTVTSLDLESQLDYVSVPRLAEEAYLRAKITNTSQYILLPGQASIFHEGDFVGSTWLETVVPNQEFEAQLGVDDRVKVERELTTREISKTFIGNTRKNVFGFKITVSSFLAWPTRVTLYDQFPVSRNEQIKSKLVEVKPPPVEQSELNILKWELPVAPEQKQVLHFEFEVDFPRDLTVTGLDL
ncbi:MAG: mucoidy inhibitor MuiA family protein [Chloroflexota bacterium]|nr:mucoidy inhibitor MuiA family protein [Chloroflexota bacterium]MDQ5865800.1 mucoidy inhibitor MuiA family protein [Chloroflexota bacterium]